MQMIRRHGGFAILLAVVLAVAVWLWGMGGAVEVTRWAAEGQREAQGALARALRAVRAGDVWAWGVLLGVCFSYGFFHAAGPGHGKLVMGGYALGEDVPRLRLVALSLAASLGQAVTAILLVYAGIAILGWGRQQLTGAAEEWLAPLSYGAIALVGAWLVWRGVRRWRLAAEREVAATGHDHDHHHSHHHDACADCGHAHGPSIEQVARVTTLREAAVLVGSIALRPCTGAIFVLILTFQMGIALAGIAGALVMGLGTGLLTVSVALLAGHLREGLLARAEGSAGRRAMAGIEIAAGLVVAILAAQLVLASV